MSSPDDIARALAGFRTALDAGRAAHAWVIVGAPRGAAMAVAEGMLQLLFCSAPTRPCGDCPGCRGVRAHAQADILWIEPESRSRAITVDRFRYEILPRLSQKSFGGGWKAVVVLHADRMTEETSNAFLKTLEEPAPQTMILLLTDSPDQLLTTIMSRCQRLVAGGGGDPAMSNPWRERMLDLLATGAGRGVAGRMAAAAALHGLYEEIRTVVEKEVKAEAKPEDAEELRVKVGSDVVDARVHARLIGFRRDLLRLVSEWQRDLLALVLGAESAGLRHEDRAEALRRQAAGLDYGAALMRVRKAEDMSRQFDRNLASDAVFWAFYRDLPVAASTR